MFDSPEIESNISNISYKQFKRSFPGGPQVNFTTALSGRNDFDVKTYTNFYLTDKFLLSDITTIDTAPLKVQEIATTLFRGKGTKDRLNFSPPANGAVGYNYGFAKFSSCDICTFAASSFNLQIFDNNRCRLYATVDYRKFFLCLDDQNAVFFVKEAFLPNDPNAINPQDFTYLFSTGVSGLLLFKDTLSGFFFLRQSGDDLSAFQVTTGMDTTYANNYFLTSRNLYYKPLEDFDFNFVTYNDDNTINPAKSKFNLKNNFLLHKKYSDDGNPTDLIVLKNQLLQNDVFSSANSLLSSDRNSTNSNLIFADDLRDYTAICGDIKEETSSELELNYVFFNKPYEIRPGKTEFLSPSSLYPFTQLNINDSKFIDSGAFSFITPEFADKVYRLSNQKQNYDAGQHLLCTWLSGGIYGDKVWVDRYFYPDLIRKEEAIALKPYLAATYDDVVETLVKSNVGLRENLLITPIFDKISDMVFEPNQKYIYERLKVDQTPLSSVTQVTGCDVITTNIPLNYFKEVNAAGAFTMFLTFDGDDRSWVVYSDRNTVDAGITITKTKDSITIEYVLFDQTKWETGQPLDQGYNPIFTETFKFKPLKTNYLSVGVDSIKGDVYFIVNNDLRNPINQNWIRINVSTTLLASISASVTGDAFIPPTKQGPLSGIGAYNFLNQSLLYGDFRINVKDTSGKDTNLLLFDGYVRDFQIFNELLDPNLTFILPVLNGDIKIDTIYITLPCGQRNSIDNIDLLQHICASSSFKSNNINIFLKNLNIDSEDVVQSIKNTIISNIDSQIPVNTSIKEIKTENYL